MVADEPEAGPPEAPPAASPARRSILRRRAPLLILLAGGALAAYLASRGPRTQHVRFVLGAAASEVTMLEVQYVDPEGDVARQARLTFDAGAAPRVVPHEPELPDGDYRLRIEVDAREGRRAVERQVTLSGGTTSVDLAGALTRSP